MDGVDALFTFFNAAFRIKQKAHDYASWDHLKKHNILFTQVHTPLFIQLPEIRIP